METAQAEARLSRLLQSLQIPRDKPLFMHSAFRMAGRDGFDPHQVLDALSAHISDAALLLPTMSWRYVKPDNPVFDARHTPSNTGILSEVFRTEYATARSLHPTHSVAGRGPGADAFLDAHHLSDTPCAANSPFGRLVENDAHILLFGITMDCCTVVHHCEEMVAPDLYLRPSSAIETYTCTAIDGISHSVNLRRHLLLPRDYYQFQDTLAAAGKLRIAALGQTICRAFRARDLNDIVIADLQRDPTCIIANPGQRFRMM